MRTVRSSKFVGFLVASLGTLALFLIGFAGEPLVGTPTHPPADRTVVEWVPFRLAEGVEDATLVKASDAVQNEFLSKQRGFIRRELLKGKDHWADLVYWASKEDAKRAAENVAKSTTCHAYFKLMASDPPAKVHHFERLSLYSSASD